MSLEFSFALKLSREKGVGAAMFKKLIDEFKLPSIAYEQWQTKIRLNKSMSKTSLKKSSTSDKIENAIYEISNNKCVGLYYGCDGYPYQLYYLNEPPPILFASSAFRQTKFVAVVGAREISPQGELLAKHYAEKYIKQGYAIVSGGARGADRIAHETALNNNAYTVSVLGCGIDVNYPKQNSDLLNSIRKKGCVLSELMPGTHPARSFFPTRNRIIVGLAEIVVVVQPKPNSGSMITAKLAEKFGKELIIAQPTL